MFLHRMKVMERNINIINDLDGRRFVLINDIRWKGKREDWKFVEKYLREYIGEFYEIDETSEKIYISSDFPDEFANSENRIKLMGAVAKAKANAAQAVPELIKIACNRKYSENEKMKHASDAKFGWYRYEVRFALPIYNDKTGSIERYNMYRSVMLVRHAEDGNKYLYDFLSIKKETSSPLEQ